MQDTESQLQYALTPYNIDLKNNSISFQGSPLKIIGCETDIDIIRDVLDRFYVNSKMINANTDQRTSKGQLFPALVILPQSLQDYYTNKGRRPGTPYAFSFPFSTQDDESGFESLDMIVPTDDWSTTIMTPLTTVLDDVFSSFEDMLNETKPLFVLVPVESAACITEVATTIECRFPRTYALGEDVNAYIIEQLAVIVSRAMYTTPSKY
jgi:hypothetical protein